MVETTTGNLGKKVVSKEEKARIRHRAAAMKDFINSPGWLEMVAYFKQEIETHSKLLVSFSRRAVTSADLHFCRDNGLIIDLYEKIMKLPEKWIIESKEKNNE